MPKRSTATSGRRKKPPSRPHLKVLFTCVGRRVELIHAFRAAAEKLDVDLTIHGADMSWFAPAMHHVDQAHIIPPLSDLHQVDALLRIVKMHGIDMIIPLIDSELLAMSAAWERFRKLNCSAVISSEDVIQTCQNKLLTYEMLKSAGIDTPTTWSAEDALEKKRLRFPLFMKPREGSAGMGNYKIDNLEELEVLRKRVPNPIVQDFVHGIEHTLDVYTGLDGIPRCVVPRRRLEVRNGEVSKGVVVKNRSIMTAGRRVALALGNCRGVITVQCILTAEKRVRVIEINPRFGGGAPLGIRAGADYPLWLMSEHLGRAVTIKPAAFDNNIAMLRFDDSVFCTVGKDWR